MSDLDQSKETWFIPIYKRRNGEEDIIFPSKELKNILGKTLGVPLFQEQAIQIAMIAAGFSLEDTDKLRKSLATFKRNGSIEKFQKKIYQRDDTKWL